MPPPASLPHRLGQRFGTAAWPALAAGLLIGTATPTHAQDGACAPERGSRSPAIGFRIDNDLLGGQDEGYTGGFLLTLTSPNVTSFTDDPCLPAAARFINHRLTWLQPGSADRRNMSFSIGQGLFTPGDKERTDLILDDRPYAAGVVATFGYHAVRGDQLDSTLLRVGWIGPSARGEEVQRAVHKVVDSDEFRGWDNQLRDEPVFAVVREWTHRWPTRTLRDSAGWGWDTTARWGGSLGTLATHALTGVQWRFGFRLPDDYGSMPLWAAGENAALSARAVESDGWSGHAFAGADAKWVLRDITLDGNTFRDSHSVDKKYLVGEVSYGFALQNGRWKFALARTHRTREFDGQRHRPVFGSFTITRSL